MRMTAEARRDHLLDCAWDMIAADGVEHMTLARVAQRGGVSKPLAYEHFISRSGLLAALYLRYCQRYLDKMRTEITQAGSPQEAADLLAHSYVGCILGAGPAAVALEGALCGSAETEAVRRSCDEAFLQACREIFAQFGTNAPSLITLVAFSGAAKELTSKAESGAFAAEEIVTFLSGLLYPR